MRSNFKRKGECSKKWWGVDADISGRYSSANGLDSYFSGKTPAYIGYFTKVGDRCSLQLYARAGVAWYDDRTASDNRWLKPMVGVKGVYRCREGIDVFVSSSSQLLTDSAQLTVDHLFSVGGPDTESAGVDYAKTWGVDTKKLGRWRLGFYGGLDYV